MAAVAALAFEDIRSERDGRVYPRRILGGCRDALVLFAGGFLGKQDAFWIADAGLHAVCVDIRRDGLQKMAEVYPESWSFVEADVYEFVRSAAAVDVVSVDCPSGHFDRCADLLDVFCGLARRYVILGCGERTEVFPPQGWALLERRKRSDFAGGTYWAVLGRTP